jgi:hypothetical protein
MRCSELLLVLATQGCAEPLHGDGTTVKLVDASSPAPVATGCRPFANIASSVTGALRSTAYDVGTVFVVDNAVVGGQAVPALTLTSSTPPLLADCLASTAASSPPVSALSADFAPRAALTIGGTLSLFYATFGSGYGVTTLGTAPSMALWTSDRPAYGTAAVTSEGTAYVYGCLGAGFLDANCYVASVPAASLGDEAAYQYYVGGGRWSASVDDAWPMVSAGTEMDVTWVPGQSRWLMAYAPPLGTTIVLRSGLSPAGPWSAPIPAVTCDLADPDMFCAGVHFHPSVAAPRGSVALSYAIASLSSDAATRQASAPLAWWPRLISLVVPSLP